GRGKVLSWTTFRRKYFDEYPAPHTTIVLELDEGPLFVSYPVDVAVEDLRESMVLSLRWTDGQDKFGEYNLPVFGPPSA
ncbi:OB-fold domain-containing protein, partial [Ensifer sp. SSB1]|uniref:OB-fold domain-containing protein n=1 Tax=Ensifer sp. SSB1 TaxID=2795385 RepID=UPI001A3BB2D6